MSLTTKLSQPIEGSGRIALNMALALLPLSTHILATPGAGGAHSSSSSLLKGGGTSSGYSSCSSTICFRGRYAAGFGIMLCRFPKLNFSNIFSNSQIQRSLRQISNHKRWSWTARRWHRNFHNKLGRPQRRTMDTICLATVIRCMKNTIVCTWNLRPTWALNGQRRILSRSWGNLRCRNNIPNWEGLRSNTSKIHGHEGTHFIFVRSPKPNALQPYAPHSSLFFFAETTPFLRSTTYLKIASWDSTVFHCFLRPATQPCTMATTEKQFMLIQSWTRILFELRMSFEKMKPRLRPTTRGMAGNWTIIPQMRLNEECPFSRSHSCSYHTRHPAEEWPSATNIHSLKYCLLATANWANLWATFFHDLYVGMTTLS